MPSQLATTTVKALLAEGRLPSGVSFTLVPDTIENSLALEEVEDSAPIKKKAVQAACVLQSVGPYTFRQDGLKSKEADAQFVSLMLDTDVQFIALAWAAYVDGFSVSLSEEGIQCPNCARSITELKFDGLNVFVRNTPISGKFVNFDMPNPENLPPSLVGASFQLCDPTWDRARKFVPVAHWGNNDIMNANRAYASMMVTGRDGSVRPVSHAAEFLKMRTKHVSAVVDAIKDFVPHFDTGVDIACPSCGVATRLPFKAGAL